MLRVLTSYFKYAIQVKNLHRVHSPFVYDLYEDCIKSKRNYYAFNRIEKCRTALLSDSRRISDPDPGAGNRKGKSFKVKDIAAKSLIEPKGGRFLFELSKKLGCKNVLELGSSLGISASYLAAFDSNCKVQTIEGRPTIAEIAIETFISLNLKNIELHSGLFDEVLPKILSSKPSFDLVYLDGNHRLDATLRYVKQVIPYLHSNSVIIVDDIRWSDEMWQAWEKLQSMDEFHVCIDLLKMGILFTRPFQAKENFTLYF
jgi:predicted O-methyltransferase YrrM